MTAMTRVLFGSLMVACLASTATAARWKYPPGPPFRACADTLRIFDIEQADTTLAPCHPATLDTVWGVRGIVTGFDAKASAFAVYFQNSQGGPFSGVEAFTGAFNYSASPFNLLKGDSIVVYGTMQESPNPNGTTEIEGPDVLQSTNDIIIRKISSSNPLPPAHVGTTAELDWLPSISAATAEPWENCLVRLNGPLHVARTVQALGVGFGSFLIVSNSALGDSVLVDGNTLTTFAVPALNTPIDFVQGILAQATSSSVNSYRVQLRDANDIATATPPNLTDAYSIEDNLLRLVFDRNLEVTSAQDEFNYGLGSSLDGSTVNSAVLETNPGNVVRLSITSVRVDGDLESVTAQDVGSLTCQLCLMSSQTRTFANGVLAISDIQKPDLDSLPLFDDRSKFAGVGSAAGTRLTIRGVSTGAFGSFAFVEDAAGGLRSGLALFAPSATLVPGDKYLIAGQVQEFGRETQIVNTVYIVDEGLGIPPQPALQSVGVLADTTTDMTQTHTTGEDYEGMLVRLQNVKCTENRGPGQSFFVTTIAPSTDTLFVSNLGNGFTAKPDSNEVLNVQGVLHFTNGTFRICPRSNADIDSLGVVAVSNVVPGRTSLSVFPNPSRSPSARFSLAHADRIELAVYDVAGRLVAVLAKGPFPAGANTRSWDGRDRSGNEASSGVYFYRLRVGAADPIVLRAVRIK